MLGYRRVYLAAGLVTLATIAPDLWAQGTARTRRAGGISGSELVIVASDFAFDAPEQVDAGLVNIRMFNQGKEMHHVLVIKIDRLDRLSQVAEYLKANDWNVPWMHPMGGPEAVGPGGVSSASMVLEPGRYVLACIVSSPTTNRLHFMDGMIRELSVVKGPAATATATLPPTEVTLKLFEWNFTLDGPLFAGRRTIRVENIGKMEHHGWLVRLNKGASVEQAVKWAENPSGPAPFIPVGGTTGLGPGRAMNITVDLVAGEYAWLCTLYNPLSKKPHTGHGMFKAIRVVN